MSEAKEFFIKKRGLYYGPDNRGYTDRPILAGLYTKTEAISTTHQNGFDGPRDGVYFIHESECGDADYLAFKAQAKRIEELEAKLAAKEKLVLALAGDKIDLVSELAGVNGKLAKAVEALEWVKFGGGPSGESYHELACQVLAELRGQDDE